MSLYVQLSRATSWEGITLRSEPRRIDFIEPVNQLDAKLTKGMEELERLAGRTREEFERRRGGGSGMTGWFESWQAMPEEADAGPSLSRSSGGS